MNEAYSPVDLEEMGEVLSVDDQLCFARPFDISPDSTQVAFTWNATGTWEIHVVPIEGGAPRRLTSGPGNKYYPRWSPDGKRITYLFDPAGFRSSLVAATWPRVHSGVCVDIPKWLAALGSAPPA